MVGLKQNILTKIFNLIKCSNSTMVGLKHVEKLLFPIAQNCSNSTMVGLKQSPQPR